MAQDINIGQLAETLNDKADIDLNNTNALTTSNNGQAKLVNPPTLESDDNSIASTKYVTDHDDELITKNLFNYTTNRILEIPQDIKYTFVEKTLTIKSGTKVYSPNGFEEDGVTRKFVIKVLTKDYTYTNSFIGTYKNILVSYKNEDDVFWHDVASTSFSSGESDDLSGVKTHDWFDTKNNIIYHYEGTSTESSGTCSLPIIQMENSGSNGFTKVANVFNGFGFIGGIRFKLPGVKFLGATGLNENGTLKTQVYTQQNIDLNTCTGTRRLYLIDRRDEITSQYINYYIQSEEPTSGNYFWFNPDRNFVAYRSGSITSAVLTTTMLGCYSYVELNSDKIVDMKIQSPNVNMMNTWSRRELGSICLPSVKYDTLTPGASGATYTAPANGWFSAMNGNGKNGFCSLQNQAKKIGSSGSAAQSITDGMTFVPVSTGDTVILKYSDTFNSLNQGWFRFIYVQSEQ